MKLFDIISTQTKVKPYLESIQEHEVQWISELSENDIADVPGRLATSRYKYVVNQTMHIQLRHCPPLPRLQSLAWSPAAEEHDHPQRLLGAAADLAGRRRRPRREHRRAPLRRRGAGLGHLLLELDGGAQRHRNVRLVRHYKPHLLFLRPETETTTCYCFPACETA